MKKNINHGISIEITRAENSIFIKLQMNGKLTHQDYEVMIPMIENVIKGVKEPQIKIFIDAVNFDGWEVQALWDDLKFGIANLQLFTKIAFVGNKKWEEYFIKISSYFMIGDIKYFEDIDKALTWINTPIPKLNTIQKELLSRKDEIQNSLELLFKANMKITDWDIPEVDDKKVAENLLNILSEKFDEIKKDVENGKYNNY